MPVYLKATQLEHCRETAKRNKVMQWVPARAPVSKAAIMYILYIKDNRLLKWLLGASVERSLWSQRTFLQQDEHNKACFHNTLTSPSLAVQFSHLNRIVVFNLNPHHAAFFPYILWEIVHWWSSLLTYKFSKFSHKIPPCKLCYFAGCTRPIDRDKKWTIFALKLS